MCTSVADVHFFISTIVQELNQQDSVLPICYAPGYWETLSIFIYN